MKTLKNFAPLLLTSSLAVALSLSCAPKPEPAKDATEVEPPAPAEAKAESMESEEEEEHGEFDRMSPEEKINFMKTKVVPTMSKVFQEFDAEEFGQFGCSTCHGPGARDGNFSMPNKSLPALDQEEMAEHPEMTKFMKEKVMPTMAGLLGEEPGPEGFGCFECHTKKE